MNWLNKFERRHPRFGIQNIMIYVIVAMGFVYLANIVVTNVNFYEALMFNRTAILSGQIWRFITFIFLPPDSSILFIIITLYFYYFIGNALEAEWGTVSFSMFYLIGMIGTIIGGFITGTATNTYLNISLYFAFAIIYPNHPLYLFFFLPVKVKYLAFIAALAYIISFITMSWPHRVSMLVSLINIAIFFGGTFVKRIKTNLKYSKTRRNFRQQNRQSKMDRDDRWR